METHYLACDLGAESGRIMLGTLADGRLALQEVHRFANAPIRSGDSLHWDIANLFAELKLGLRKAATLRIPIASISTDSWGVDYVLYDLGGNLMPPVFHYRDPRTTRGVEIVNRKVSSRTIFDETGIQFMPLNTLYQLAAEPPERLARSARMLTIGDAFNYWLCGEACVDASNASTTQLYNPRTQQWSRTLIRALGFPEMLFPPIVQPGTRLGPMKDELAREVGLPRIEVVASCSHDTGAAIVGVPADAGNWAYLSSGTWSLLGVELPAPIINDACRELNFTNEIGYGGTVRLLKNISGLWLVQECRREWARGGGEFDYPRLAGLASSAAPFVSLINPADPRFIAPGDMTKRIAVFCQETHQTVPATPGAIIRCVLESLALLYRRTLRQVEHLTGQKIDRLHVVGGGSRNELLNQFTANALPLPVLAGPAEATAAGNVLVQALALGHLSSLAAAREVLRASFPLKSFLPREGSGWERAAARFEEFFDGKLNRCEGSAPPPREPNGPVPPA